MLESLEKIPNSFFSREGKSLSFIAYAFLVLLCIGFFTPGIVSMPPTDRDESLFAQASKQMVETGNYTDIRVQNEPRYKKPIGIYWLQSASARFLIPHNLNEIWAYRIPSFIGATVAVLMTAALGALLFSPAAGLLAAMMLAGCVLLNVEARLATTDAVLLGCIVTAMYALAKAYVPSPLRQHNFIPFVFWTTLAVGILVKGPVILLPVFGVLLWLNFSDRSISWFRGLRPSLGIPYALALIAPWFIAISLQSHGAFIQQSAGNDMLAKLWQGQNRGMLPPGLHLLAFPLLFFPYALFTFFSIPDVLKNRHDPAIKFCLGWIVPAWLVFELSLTKLPHYVLPAYPAIALLTAKYLTDGFPALGGAKHRLPISLIVGLWLALGTGFAFFFSGILPHLSDRTVELPELVAAVVLILAQGAALILFFTKKTASLVILTISGLIFLPTTLGYTLPHLRHIWLSREIVETATAVRPCPQSQIVSVGYHEPSLVFMAGTGTILAKTAAEAAEALKQDDCRIAVVADSNKQDFLDAFPKDGPKPQEVGSIEGLDAGRGKRTSVSVLTMVKP